jgi:integrase
VIKAYLKSNKLADGALFTSQSNSSKQKRLTTRGLRGIVKAVFNRLGIDKSVHGTRHFFITQLIKSYKGDLLKVSLYSRHKNIETLQVYNDDINLKADLPRYYEVFNELKLSK